MVYVLTLTTWEEWGRAHHTYGRIYWDSERWQSADSLAPADVSGYRSLRHETRESAIAGAREWFAAHAAPGDVLLIGTWTLLGWDESKPFEVLEGKLPNARGD
jgi:hypothetical protein